MKSTHQYYVFNKAIICLFVLSFVLTFNLNGQTYQDSLEGFNREEALKELQHHGIDKLHKSTYLKAMERRFINKKYGTGPFKSPGKIPQAARALSGDCSTANWGFEDGSLNNWTSTGTVNVVNSGTDPYGNYPWVYPGGNYSVRISSDQGPNHNDGSLQRVINVPSTGITLFSFHFAMSIFNFPHPANMAAKFYVEFYDQSGAKLPCPDYVCYYSTDDGIVGVPSMLQTMNNARFYNPNCVGDSPNIHNVTYSNWNNITLNLTPYAGTSITVLFKVEWCWPGPDWAYALVDVDCPVNTTDTVTSCFSSNPADNVLQAPANMASYTWMDNAGNTLGTTQNLSISAPGTYKVKCTPANNVCDPNQTPFTVVFRSDPYPLPKIDIAPYACTSEPVNVSDTANYSTQISDWQWTVDGSDEKHGNPIDTSFTNSGYHSFELLVTNSSGCSNTVEDSILIYDKPTADFTFTNACDNDTVYFYDASSSVASTITNYYWDAQNDGIVDDTNTQISYLYNQEGFYDARLIVKTDKGCYDTITKQVTVYALPQADFSFTKVCEDTISNFTNTSTLTPVDNGSIVQYEWDFGNGSTSTSENTSIAYGAENIYDVSLITTTNYGCKDTITKHVDVYPLPHVNFSPTDVCLLFSTQFTDLSTISNQHTSNSNVSWLWDFADGDSSYVQNPVHTYATDGTYNAHLVVTSNHGCDNDTTLTVTVYPLPVVDFVGQNLEGCSPVCPSVQSTTTINNPSSLASFDWTLSNGNTYSGQSISDCFENLTGTDEYYDLTLKVTSDQGCVSSKTKTNYIAVYHNPVAGFYTSPENPTIKKPDIIHHKVRYHNTSLYADFYEWNISDAPLINSSDENPLIDFPENPATYQSVLIAHTNKGCTDTARASVRIWDRVIVYIPNTFTPDKDNFNETFKPVFYSGFDPYDYTLYIFNRWGELIFESHNTNVGWDGTYGDKVAQDGTYIWKIIFKEKETDKHHTLKGHVNLIK